MQYGRTFRPICNITIIVIIIKLVRESPRSTGCFDNSAHSTTSARHGNLSSNIVQTPPGTTEKISDTEEFNTTLDKDLYDVLKMSPIKFDPAFKNPCWTGNGTNGPIADEKFHCVPYFFLIGVRKSATTDLFSRITLHPEYARSGFKESQWLSSGRWGVYASEKVKQIPKEFCEDIRSVSCYIKMFEKATEQISHSVYGYIGKNHELKSALITGDGSPSHMHVHTNWQQLPGNEGLLEPKYTNFHYLNHVSPKSKILVIFRDPVKRLYSDFLMTMGTWEDKQMATPEVFHDHVTQLTHAYTDCFNRWSLRRCIYNETLRLNFIQNHNQLARGFICGFYAFFMKEMRSVFGKNRIHSIITEYYRDNMENNLREVFSFLDMSELRSDMMEFILQLPPQLVRKIQGTYMLTKTRDMLYSFYEPYNQDMAALMDDERYLFPQHK